MKQEEKKGLFWAASLFTLFCLAGIIAAALHAPDISAFTLFADSPEAAGRGEAHLEIRGASAAPGAAEAAGRTDPAGAAAPDSSAARSGPVYLTGAVRQEGIYLIGDNCYLYELIDLAGGLTEEAASEAVNLASRVEPECHIRIPSVKEFAAGGTGSYAAAALPPGKSAAKIDLNRAGLKELMSLPGIGEKTAADIIAYRETAGGFKRTEELMKVAGIKEGRYEKIKDLIRVG